MIDFGDFYGLFRRWNFCENKSAIKQILSDLFCLQPFYLNELLSFIELLIQTLTALTANLLTAGIAKLWREIKNKEPGTAQREKGSEPRRQDVKILQMLF